MAQPPRTERQKNFCEIIVALLLVFFISFILLVEKMHYWKKSGSYSQRKFKRECEKKIKIIAKFIYAN